GEHDRRIERLRRLFVRPARPFGAELQRVALRIGIAGAREREHAAALPARDLGEDVRRGTEPVEADAARVAAHAQRARADQPGAQEWCGLSAVVSGRDRKAVAGVGDRVLGEAAVEVAAGEARLRTQVLATRAAILTAAAGPAQPGHADALADAIGDVSSGLGH